MACGPLPEDSRLAKSLERGHFLRSYESWSVIGSGGCGKVLKAWHTNDKKWYAVKLIPMDLRPAEVVDDRDNWCGAELFNHLVSLRSSSVVRYFRRWVELPEDIDNSFAPQGCSPTARSDACSFVLQGNDSFCSAGVSSFSVGSSCGGGFEWLLDPAEVGNQPSPTVPQVKQRDEPHRVVLVIQMEFCDGVTLDQWIMQPQLRRGFSCGLDEALQLFKQLVAGLAELHRKGIVHRDVKPENVMILTNGQLKIVDFDLARCGDQMVGLGPRQMNWPRLPPGNDSESLTEVGTPGYAPPEQCWVRQSSISSPPSSPAAASALPLGLPSNSWDEVCSGTTTTRPKMLPRLENDIFSAGIVLVELTMAAVKNGPAWQTAMERASAIQALRAGQGEFAALPVEVRRALGLGTHGWLRQLMFRMLAWDVHVRPSSEEVLRELHTKLNSKDRQNPYIGVFRGSSPQLSAMADPPTSAQNPYVGFFLDHAPKTLEKEAVGFMDVWSVI